MIVLSWIVLIMTGLLILGRFSAIIFLHNSAKKRLEALMDLVFCVIIFLTALWDVMGGR